MQLERAQILSQELVAENSFLMWLSCPGLAKGALPGRFLMVHIGDGSDSLLPRPMSFHRFRQAEGDRQFAILYDVRGRGTAWLAGRAAGDELTVFGPLGKGCELEAQTSQLLLVAGGLGVAALLPLADEAVAKRVSVTLLQGVRTAAKLFPPALLPPEVEFIAATDDGSQGHKGPVTELVQERLAWAEQVVACGPRAMLEALAGVTRQPQARRRPSRGGPSVQVLMEEHMACGTGVCYGCAVFTPKGVRLVCKDGPTFDIREVFR